MLNHYFHSFFTRKEHFNIKDIEPKEPLSMNFSILRRNFREILTTTDINKVQGSDGFSSILFQKTSAVIAETHRKVFKNLKPLRRKPVTWKSVSSIFRQTDRRQKET